LVTSTGDRRFALIASDISLALRSVIASDMLVPSFFTMGRGTAVRVKSMSATSRDKSR
jgi:hypothetical protein